MESEVEQFIRSNTIKVQEQTSFQENYQHLCELYNTSKANLEKLTAEKNDKQSRVMKLSNFVSSLFRQEELINEFNEKNWHTFLKQVFITDNKTAIFTFKSGQEIEL